MLMLGAIITYIIIMIINDEVFTFCLHMLMKGTYKNYDWLLIFDGYYW